MNINIVLLRELIESAHDGMSEKDLSDYLRCTEKIRELVDRYGEQAVLAVAEFVAEKWIRSETETPNKIYVELSSPKMEH